MSTSSSKTPVSSQPPLNESERRIIEGKGTEPPFSGRFVDHHDAGTYRCRRCGSELFRSSSKFDSGSGWPSFDDALAGAVEEHPDPDGMRTEIVCAHCQAHLGHVFRGERFTANDTRHCVNSLSLTFTKATRPDFAYAYFAGGCFWGVEHHFEQATGVVEAESGYMGGKQPNPSYEDVCANRTSHAETVRVKYNPSLTSYAALAKLFFEIHDPTQVDRQGPDVGKQYRSMVFVSSEAERRTVMGLIQQLATQGLQVATAVEPAGHFWPAEDYHQDYYARTGKTPYCHHRVHRFDC